MDLMYEPVVGHPLVARVLMVLLVLCARFDRKWRKATAILEGLHYMLISCG